MPRSQEREKHHHVQMMSTTRDHPERERPFPPCGRDRGATAGLVGALQSALLAAAFLASARPALAADKQVFTCTNPSSGTTWTIVVRYDRQRVDSSAESFPASITSRRITWRDTTHGGTYELRRATGELTVRYASSTGGYALHDHCSAQK
jgi:hypothetical protein